MIQPRTSLPITKLGTHPCSNARLLNVKSPCIDIFNKTEVRVNNISREVAEQKLLDLPRDAGNHLLNDIYINYHDSALGYLSPAGKSWALLQDHTNIQFCKSLK